ncbi:MAG: ROK family protein [Planctomycetaceae bacterium]|nr:ROK family protein [Planctomycetaceae bacterium]
MTQIPFPLLAIDIGGSKLVAAVCLVDSEINHGVKLFHLLQKSHDVTLAPTTPTDELLKFIDSAVDEVFDAAKILKCDIKAIGANIPGLAEPISGTWVYACFSGIRNFPIAPILAQKYNKPVFIENDVNACALAEKYFGGCREVENFLWVTVSNGVGGGLVLRGDIFSGSFGNAGEIGHFCVEEDACEAIHCGCGNFGCLEAQAAGPGIARRFKKLTGKDETAATIATYAKQGDTKALAIYEKTGYYLGKAIAASINLINPGKIVLGGGVSQSFELFAPAMQATVNRQVFRDANQDVVIEPTELGTDAALAGAAALALRGLR